LGHIARSSPVAPWAAGLDCDLQWPQTTA